MSNMSKFVYFQLSRAPRAPLYGMAWKDKGKIVVALHGAGERTSVMRYGTQEEFSRVWPEARGQVPTEEFDGN